LKFAASIIAAILAISPSARRERFGVSLSFGGICKPRFSSCLRTAGSFKASTAAALSFATTSLGVSLGTQRPDHSVMWNPGNPASSTVGMSAADSTRLLSVMA
jgi:hypothetical protein